MSSDHQDTSNGDPDVEKNIRSSLEELDAVVASLVQQNDLTRAVHFSLRALDIRRRFFGLGSPDLEQARIQSAQLIVQAAKVHQANDRHKETAELLAHVDRMTEHTLPNTPELLSLDRSRRVARLEMMKELLIARYRQGRHRAALTFGRYVLELARETMSLHELPSIHLNIASVHSALGQHKESLRHCYVAFQKLCLILEAHEYPDTYPFVIAALSLESLDKAGVEKHQEAFQTFLKCCSLAGDEMGEDVDVNSVAPSFKAPSATEGSESIMSAERRRWGGALALAFRSMAAEQEHLNLLDGALLTYKVAHTTALSCLGANHPVSHQCDQALRDAEQSAKTRKTPSRGTVSSAGGAAPAGHSNPSMMSRVRAGTPAGGKRDSTASSTHTRDHPSGSAAFGPAAGVGARAVISLKRPAWNEWFNSDLPVPLHHEERHKEYSRPPSRNVKLQANQSLELSAISDAIAEQISMQPRGSLPPMRGAGTAAQHSHNRGNGTEDVKRTFRSVSPLPPRPSTSSFGDMSTHKRPPIPAANNTGNGHAVRRPHSADDFSNGYSPQRGSSGTGSCINGEGTFEPISLADFSFLQNTFKLRYDINFNRPNHRFGTGATTRAASRERREIGALMAERAHAEALAAELGVV